MPTAMVVYGYPIKAQKDRRKPARFEQEYIVFENKYRRLTSEEHIEMHRTRNQRVGREVEDIHADVRVFCNRKYMSDFSIEMSRSAVEYLRKFDFRKCK